MNTYVGISGDLSCPLGLGIEVRSIQADVLDASVTDVTVTLSGSLGTRYSFNAITPVVGDFRFAVEEDVNVDSAGSINNLVLNYIFYGDQVKYKEGPWNGTRLMPGKWDVS